MRRRRRELAVAYRAHFRHVGLIDLGGEEVIQLDDIGHHAAGGFDCNLEIGEDLLNLCLEIALANDLAGSVARDLAGNIDDRSAIDLGDV